jgi:hypothetical protein
LLLAVLPFWLLLRGGVYAYTVWGLDGRLALLVSGLTTSALLVLYASLLFRRFGIRVSHARLLRWTGLLVLVFCSYGLMYLSGANSKSPSVRSTYTSLHPLLRMSVSTLILTQPSLVVTDAARTPEDYGRMGLSVNAASLHYRQASGYVHAVDLRTQGRPEWANVLMTVYFRMLGFSTLRHVGTADHLHVSLPLQAGSS